MKNIKQVFKNFLKKFNLFELIFLPLSLISIIVVLIICKNDALSIIYSIISIFAVFSLSKGYFLAPILLIIMQIFYAILSYMQAFYGEVILTFAIVIPLQIYAFISWFLKNKKDNTKSGKMIIRKISVKEWCIVLSASVVALFGVYFLLKLFNTNYLELSTLIFVGAILGYYLTMRGSKYQFLFFTATNIIAIIMWVLPFVQGVAGGEELIVIVVSKTIFSIININGFINWWKMEKSINQKNSNEINDDIYDLKEYNQTKEQDIDIKLNENEDIDLSFEEDKDI